MRVDSEAMDSDEDGQQFEKEGPEKTKRQMKTPYQLETLEKAYLRDKYPSEAARAELSKKLGLTDRQLQMWYCHRRSKAKKEAAGLTPATKPPRTAGNKRSEMESSSRDIEPVSSKRRRKMVRRIVAFVEALLGEPLREDGPILGLEYDSLPPGAFGTPLLTIDHQYNNKNSDEEDRVERDSKRVQKELEKQEQLKRKMEEQMKREMEKQERDRKKEELRLMREQQRREEMEKREIERREKLLQKEQLRAERKKQQDDIRRERELAKQKAAMERAEARRIAKESLELIEDERLELMDLAARSKGLPSISSLDAKALQELESFRDSLREFPPESVKSKKPFGDSEENVGNLLMVWKFCTSFADVLGLNTFTIDEFIQAFHDHDSRLLGEMHTALLRMIIKDIVDVVRSPTGGPGSNQYSIINPEGGHPQVVEGASVRGFDIRGWQRHLNPLTWPEILRQFALSAGFGPEIKKKRDENDKGCEDIVSSLRNGSAARNAVNAMKNKGVSLTPGTVKFAAYHVLALEGSKGLNVVDLAEKILEYGLRGSSTTKTISVALSRDPVLFERIAPSTYNVRPAYRKDPAEAEALLAEALDKVQRFANGVLTGQTAEDDEADHGDSDNDVVADLATPSDEGGNEVEEGGASWVKGLAEGEYCEMSVEDRLDALSSMVGIANQGNSMRVLLEERLESACALKKQMLAEAQLDKRHKNGSLAKDEEIRRALIGHRAEEMHVYRCAPLGSDRRRNRYWHFGCGGIFVESAEGFWSLIDTQEAFDALLMSLDSRGVRESHLHMMLQKVEVAFQDSDLSEKPESLEPSSTFKDLVQLVARFEGGDTLSSNVQTREELLRYCASVKSLNQLPRIPRTTAAVALRILVSITPVEEEQKPDIQQEYKLASSKRKREDALEVNGRKRRTTVGKRRTEKSTPEEKPVSPSFREVEDSSSSSDDEEWGSGFTLAPCRTKRNMMVETSEEEGESEDDNVVEDNAAQPMDSDSDSEEEEEGESEDDNVVEDDAAQHMDSDSDLEEEEDESEDDNVVEDNAAQHMNSDSDSEEEEEGESEDDNVVEDDAAQHMDSDSDLEEEEDESEDDNVVEDNAAQHMNNDSDLEEDDEEEEDEEEEEEASDSGESGDGSD